MSLTSNNISKLIAISITVLTQAVLGHRHWSVMLVLILRDAPLITLN